VGVFFLMMATIREATCLAPSSALNFTGKVSVDASTTEVEPVMAREMHARTLKARVGPLSNEEGGVLPESPQVDHVGARSSRRKRAAATFDGGSGDGSGGNINSDEKGGYDDDPIRLYSGDPYLEALLVRQAEACPRVLAELEAHGCKVGHWAWWVFPTEKPGFSEPPPATAVSPGTAHALLERAPPSWRLVLEQICSLSRAQPQGIQGVLPPMDLPRVKYFVKFWSSVPERPPWLSQVLVVLGEEVKEMKARTKSRLSLF